MTWPALRKEIRMKIKVVKKGSFNVKPSNFCPFAVDDDVATPKK